MSMVSKMKTWALGVGVAFVVTSASAIWPFGGKDDDASKYVTAPEGKAKENVVLGDSAPAAVPLVRSAHMTFADAAREKSFLELATGRTRTREDMAVVARLIAEKRLEVARFTKMIEDEFGVKPDGNYHYDKSDSMLYELVAGAATGTNAAANLERKDGRKLTKEQEERFVRLASSKRLSAEQIRILRLLEEEKRIELRTIEDALKRGFDVAADRNYEYDVDTKTVYEMVPADKAGKAAN